MGSSPTIGTIVLTQKERTINGTPALYTNKRAGGNYFMIENIENYVNIWYTIYILTTGSSQIYNYYGNVVH